MITIPNMYMPGAVFNHGLDATADLLNASQQYTANEITERIKDFVKYPGFAYGIRISDITGQTITLSQGSGVDQYGSRIYIPNSTGYGITPPAVTSSNQFYLCIKAQQFNVAYKSHPYDGTRKSTELAMGVQVFTDTAVQKDNVGNIYPSAGNGLVVAFLTIIGSTYSYLDTPSLQQRSCYMKMKDGQP